MTSSLMLTLAVVAGVAWLAFSVLAALRPKSPRELGPNQSPGITDDVLEGPRLERTQIAAVLLSGFLAVSLPLYYLGEPDRQESFHEQFDEESLARGEVLVTQYACFSCHGPGGAGGNAPFLEKRSGVNVAWMAPSLDTIFYRYGPDEVAYWVTYGRANTPMPAWGTAGGGPLNEAQVVDIVRYLESIQLSQDDAAARVETEVTAALAAIDSADATIDSKILEQKQVIADLDRSVELAEIINDIAERASTIGDSLSEGLDTDGDGVSDVAEGMVNRITAEARAAMLLSGLEDRSFDPNNSFTNGSPDMDEAVEFLTTLKTLARRRAPLLAVTAAKVEAAINTTEGEDSDGDGLVDSAEVQLTALVREAQAVVLPPTLRVTHLDPLKEESQVGIGDRSVAVEALAAIESISLNVAIDAENYPRLVGNARAGLGALLQDQKDRRWDFDFDAIANRTFGDDVDRARRVVGVFNAYCARCHTSSFAGGVVMAQEAGSGGFGPAIYQGRAALQFLSDEELSDFLAIGGVAGRPYGVSGMGKANAPMPGFGMILSQQDLDDLAHWLRVGDLNGKGDG